VVGAGISGLVTGRRLAADGHRVVVLEGRDRVGGRLVSVEVGGVGLDLGATWFWFHERRVNDLIGELGVAIYRQHLDGDAMYHDPRGSSRVEGNPIDVASGRFTGGADSLARAVADELPPGSLRLGVAVSHISTGPEGAVVTHAEGRIECQQVVLAVPPALAVNRIGFEPPLPDRVVRLARATPVWMGAIAKVVAVYPTAFWRSRGLAGAAISHFGPLRELHDMSGPDGSPAALFGFAPLGVGDSAPSEAEVVAQLVEIFGAEAAEPDRVIVQDWTSEEYTSPPGVAALGAYDKFGHPDFAQPVGHGRLHWSSTETAREAPGHIEGAIAGAERAARNVATALAGRTQSQRASVRGGSPQERMNP